eukprot:TRINITY_DN44749_c0_g1_i1.p1 TRINITY_DN44749_c0_g1~~TRINITY_DN44749_c0_g1_i1.p1  ORF type:complete len:601 (-),score=89.24 TRINITY_DN44749_c0_g1_i1:48-1850(-)
MPQPRSVERCSPIPQLLRLLTDEYHVLLQECNSLSLSKVRLSQPELEFPTDAACSTEPLKNVSSLSSHVSCSQSDMQHSTSTALVAKEVSLTKVNSTSVPPLYPSAKPPVVAVTCAKSAKALVMLRDCGQFADSTIHHETSDTCVDDVAAGAEAEEAILSQFQSQLGRKLAKQVKHSEQSLGRRSAKALMHVSTALSLREKNPVTISKHDFNSMLDKITVVAILLNIVYVGISSELDSTSISFSVDCTFVVFFTVERIFKIYFAGLAGYFTGGDRNLNVLETVLVLWSIADLISVQTGLWNTAVSTTFLRMFRMGRLAKFLRLLRLKICQEICLMVNCMAGGMRTLATSLILVLVPLYVVSYILRETAGRFLHDRTFEKSFSNIGLSCFTMFRCVVAGDCSDEHGRPLFAMLSAGHGWGYACIYIVLILLMNIAVFNVIVALYVDNTLQYAKNEKTSWMRDKLRNESYFASRAKELLDIIFSIEGRCIATVSVADLWATTVSEDTFVKICENARFREILRELDVAEEDQVDLFETLDVDGGGSLSMEELLVGVSKLRGEPRRADLIHILLVLRSLQMSFHAFEERCMGSICPHSTSFCTS